MNSAIRTGAVTSFRGDYAFLSNHFTNVFKWRGESFFCAEQAFQYAKTFYPDANVMGSDMKCHDMAKRLRDTGNGSTAKKYGREVPVDLTMWEGHRVQIMREIVHAKFKTGTGLVGPLINTGAMMLVEVNDWGDKFWGRCLDNDTGKMVGSNVLGVILMEERGFWSRGRPTGDYNKDAF
jgi:ribA/ribD-fused uncharacterized protein